VKSAKHREELRRQFLVKAEAIIDELLERGETEGLSLTQIEEMVSEAKFELTRQLVESVIEVQEERMPVPGPTCERCGREMHYKGEKRRKMITSQGEIEVERAYYYCAECQQGVFPPGSTVED
jgi:CRISPR/Cas system-associated protein Cas10 (large subunit of type III CRISPR-Cas system)